MPAKPTIIVFDDEWLEPRDAAGASDTTTSPSRRYEVFVEILGDFAELRGVNYFTNESLARGETGVLISANEIAHTKPRLAVLDLAISTAPGDWRSGIRLLRTLRESSALRDIPVIVASDFAGDWRARRQLSRLGLGEDDLFVWSDLEADRGETRARFRQRVLQLFGLNRSTAEKV